MLREMNHRHPVVFLLALAGAGCASDLPTAVTPARPAEIAPALANAWRDWPIASVAIELTAPPDAPPITAQRALGGAGADTAYDIWPLREGGYVITGSTTSHERDDLELFVVRIDPSGAPVWSHVFGGPGVEIGFAVRAQSDGTIVVAGWTHSFGAGAGDFLLLGIDGQGELRFAHTYGAEGEERATSLAVTRSDEVLLIGETYSHGDDARFLLVGTDSLGNRMFERTYNDGPLHDRGLAIVVNDDMLLLVGNAMDATSGSRATVSDGLAFGLDRRSGAERWRLVVDSGEHDIFHHAAPLADGEYLISGYTRGFDARGVNDMLLVKVDERGNQSELRLLGGDGADHNIMARADERGGAVLAGYTTSFGAGDWDAHVSRIASDLSVVWEHAWGGPGADAATSVVPKASGSIAVIGYTESFGDGARDILFFSIGQDQSKR